MLALRVSALLAALTLPLPAFTQAAPPVAPKTAEAAPNAVAPAPDAYRYDAAGRRDPFVSLVSRGSDAPRSASGIDGLAGLGITELSVRGILRSRAGFVAILQGPDNKTYLAKAGDHLLDGSIERIEARALVLIQEVTDPLSSVKQREVRKGLRGSDEGK